MGLPFADPYENMTPQRWQELSQRERYERDAARRRLFAGLLFCIRAVIKHCRVFKACSFFENLRTRNKSECRGTRDREHAFDHSNAGVPT